MKLTSADFDQRIPAKVLTAIRVYVTLPGTDVRQSDHPGEFSKVTIDLPFSAMERT